MRFPYSNVQIQAMVAAEKHPRDWEPLKFRHSGEASRQWDSWLEHSDGITDRIRLVVRAGRVDLPDTYSAVLLLENERVRGIDYHPVARSHFYKEVIPKGWHQDVVDPNLEPGQKGYHNRVALPDFTPLDLVDFLRKVCIHWNVLLPADTETLV